MTVQDARSAVEGASRVLADACLGRDGLAAKAVKLNAQLDEVAAASADAATAVAAAEAALADATADLEAALDAETAATSADSGSTGSASASALDASVRVSTGE